MSLGVRIAELQTHSQSKSNCITHLLIHLSLCLQDLQDRFFRYNERDQSCQYALGFHNQ